MKKCIALLIAVLMVLPVLVGCTGGAATTTTEQPKTEAAAPKSDNAAGSASLIEQAGEGSKTEVTYNETDVKKTQVEYMGYGLASQSFDLTPFYSAAGGREQILNLIWPRMIYLSSYGGKLEDAEMWLAKKVEKVDDTTYNVEIYDYIYDSKGNHITSEDIKWSYEMNMNQGQQTEIAGVYGGIDIIDDYNMVFHLNSPGDGKIEVLLGFHRLTICDKEWYESTTDDEHRVDAATAAAYRIKAYKTGSYVVLEAVDNYWQKDEALKGVSGQQNVKTIYCPIITEKAVRATEITTGEVDYASIDVSNLSMFVENGKVKPGYYFKAAGGATCMTLFLNMDKESGSPVATNEKLRQAILYAIDRESALLAAGFEPDVSAWVCNDIGTPKMAGYRPEWAETWWKYDPDKAMQLLEEAGYKDGITLRFMYTSTFNAGMIAVVQECLDAVGIHTNAEPYDQALYNQYKYDSSQWDLELDFKGGYSLMDDWYNLFNAAGYANGGANFCKDQALYDALDAGMTTGTQEAFDAIHNRLQELALGTGLYAQATLHVARDGILDMPMNNYMQPMIGAFVFADNFTSKTDTSLGN